ncbi:MAG: hypothetical protein VXW20_03500, partial [Pseudomonadota bacterium]|nr:hypothetical protein [Pseudomonadota bacterium]
RRSTARGREWRVDEACSVPAPVRSSPVRGSRRISDAPRAGVRAGACADFALVDLEAPWIVDADALQSKSKNAAIEGRKLQGKVEACFVNGQSVFDSKMETTK